MFDFSVALFAIAFLSPLLIAIALIVRFGGAGPIVYCQQRIGRGFNPFWIYKFRTMLPGSDAHGNTCTVHGDVRITNVGRFLRGTKLDELPQLFNVLKGDMSIVGPRPEVLRYVGMFSEDYRTILSVRPGITDFAAIEFRNEERILADYDDPEKAYRENILPAKIALYKKYISEQSLKTDLKIVFKTFLALFR